MFQLFSRNPRCSAFVEYQQVSIGVRETKVFAGQFVFRAADCALVLEKLSLSPGFGHNDGYDKKLKRWIENRDDTDQSITPIPADYLYRFNPVARNLIAKKQGRVCCKTCGTKEVSYSIENREVAWIFYETAVCECGQVLAQYEAIRFNLYGGS